jgi:serine/threonine protein kinase
MLCPSCQAPNEDDAGECFTCGRALSGVAPIKQGDTIGARYVIQARLGRGGMGTVYRAYDRALEEDVALKVMTADATVDPELARRFRSEIRLARKIAHRNVCRIYEYGEEAGRRFISMELIDGTDIRRRLRERGPLPPAEAYDVAMQVAAGLEAIHEAGIVHRDLKTPNVMRDAQGRVKVMDFGIAKRFDADAPSMGMTGTGHVVGTPEYMSPEQARAEKIDSRSDIYALGVVIFELFTGDLPFRADTPMAVLLKHLHEPPPLEGPRAAALPIALRPVLARALAKEPAERHASMRELIADLGRARDQGVQYPAPASPGIIHGAAVPDVLYSPMETPWPTVGTTAAIPAPATAPPTPRPDAVATSTLAQTGTSPSPSPSGRERRRRLLAGGLVVLVAAAVGVIAWTRITRIPRTPTPAAPAALAVTINALPWANVRFLPRPDAPTPSLRDDERTTPVRVLLSEGDYDIELENEGLTAPRREHVEVRAGQATAFVFVMPGYDPDAAAEAHR